MQNPPGPSLRSASAAMVPCWAPGRWQEPEQRAAAQEEQQPSLRPPSQVLVQDLLGCVCVFVLGGIYREYCESKCSRLGKEKKQKREVAVKRVQVSLFGWVAEGTVQLPVESSQ